MTINFDKNLNKSKADAWMASLSSEEKIKFCKDVLIAEGYSEICLDAKVITIHPEFQTKAFSIPASVTHISFSSSEDKNSAKIADRLYATTYARDYTTMKLVQYDRILTETDDVPLNKEDKS